MKAPRPQRVRGAGAGTSAMVAGAGVSAVGAYVFQVVGGRALGTEEFAPVAVIWTLLFIGFTVFILPVEQLVIRRVTLAGGVPSAWRASLPAVAAVVGLATAVAAGFAVLVRDAMLDGDPAFVLAAATMFPVYGAFAVARGALAGSGRFAAYGTAVAADAVAKVGGAVVVAVFGLGAVALSWALVLSPVVVFATRPFRPVADDGSVTPGGVADGVFLSGYVVATGASQTILAAGPVVVGALGASAGAISVFFMTSTLFRGPLSASYNVVARILPSLTRRSAQGDAAGLDALVRRVAGLGLLGAVAVGWAAALLGPWLVQVLYGAEFRPGSRLAGLLAAGVVLAIAGLGVTQVLVGRGHTGRLAAAWLAALAAAALAVAVGAADVSVRVAVAFVVGEAVALAGLVASALWRR